MLASDAPAYQIVAAVRTTSSEGVPGRRQILRNGGFDGTLSPWISSQTESGSEFTINDDSASVVMSLASGKRALARRALGSIILQQEIIDPAEANLGYYTSLDITVTSDSPVECQLFVRSVSGGGDTYVKLIIPNTGGPMTIYGSGTTQVPGVSTILINVDCVGENDVEIQLDNLSFWSFEKDSSGPSCDTSLLTNGDFDDSLSPWIPSQDGTSASASWSVSDGQAIVLWAANAGLTDSPARLTQSAVIPANLDYRITAQLVFNIASGSCSVVFGTNIERLDNTGQITQSGRRPISYDGFSDVQSSQFYVAVSCYSPAGDANNVGIDSVALVLNPGAKCPDETG